MGQIQKDKKTGRFLKISIDESLLISLYSTGVSESSIAKKMGHPQQTISNRLRVLGLPSLRAKLSPMIERDGLWLCERCNTYKSKLDFIYRKDGLIRFRFCKKCKYKASKDSIHRTYTSYIRNLMRHTKHRMSKSDIPYDLDAQYCIDLWDRQQGRCFYTDTMLNINNTDKSRYNHHSASLDRIIPNLGYSKGNVVWCQQRINVMKNDATLEEMKQWMPEWYRRIIENKHIYEF